MKKVRIYHSKLDRAIRVPESAVAQYALSGWVVQPEEPPAEQKPAEPVVPSGVEGPETPAAAEETPKSDAPRRRRRHDTAEEN